MISGIHLATALSVMLHMNEDEMNNEEMVKILKWIGGGDAGLSSQAIALHMATGECDGSYPHDPADLGRCLRMLAIFPSLKSRIKEMGKYGDVWKAYSERWDELEQCMADEVGIDWSKAKKAPETYRLMQEVRGAR